MKQYKKWWYKSSPIYVVRILSQTLFLDIQNLDTEYLSMSPDFESPVNECSVIESSLYAMKSRHIFYPDIECLVIKSLYNIWYEIRTFLFGYWVSGNGSMSGELNHALWCFDIRKSGNRGTCHLTLNRMVGKKVWWSKVSMWESGKLAEWIEVNQANWIE